MDKIKEYDYNMDYYDIDKEILDHAIKSLKDTSNSVDEYRIILSLSNIDGNIYSILYVLTARIKILSERNLTILQDIEKAFISKDVRQINSAIIGIDDYLMGI